ncbi:spore gernimation protein [Halalkalibacillus sediminis]|uniref:Spore gernimation protein n=1 Tax=Halalkalibacillus sediminis TaxID=2018042 RepID=A0A2I0QV57_9BACI|nr:GerAB/ArcD/ProY family transporter [Halalkalibacillus sediminis]PKR78233.1 spore gernimation protein [Halalkalibacillus sediminis]
MKESVLVPIDKQIKAAYLFIVIHTMQIGVGLAGFPRIIYMEAKQDSWFVLLLAAILLHIVIFTIVYILNSFKNEDLQGILQNLFGKWIGKIINTIFILYFLSMFLSVFVNYVEFVQVFIFPDLAPWFIGTLLIVLVVYAVHGGLRVAVGTSIIFFFITIWMVFLLIKPITMMEFDHFYPILTTTPEEWLRGVKATSFSVIGFEILWIIYPFISDKHHVQRYSQTAAIFTITLLMYVTVVSIGYFSGTQLEEKIWPVLTLFKILSMSFFERFDILLVALWMFIILPNIILLAWMVTYSINRMTKCKDDYVLIALAIIALITTIFLDERYYVNEFTDLVAQLGIYLGFIFPIALLPIVWIHKKRNNRHAKNS